MNSSKEQIIAQCYHCGNKTLMNVEYTIKKTFGGIEPGEFIGDMREDFNWKLLLCPVCNFPSLYQIYTNEAMQELVNGELNQYYETKILYPENTTKLDHVPKSVATSFEAALKIRKIDGHSCLMALRHTLEMICDNQNGSGDTLQKKIKNLIDKNVFPKGLSNSFDVIRIYGNAGAHTDNKITDYQLKELISILYNVINYLYINPKKSERMKMFLEKKSGEKNE